MAENAQENVQEVNQNEQNNADAVKDTKNAENFEAKFEEILNKRLDGVAKSVLKANGMDEDEEIKNFIDSYRAKKAENSKKITDEMEALKKENAELKEEKFKNELTGTIKSLSGKLGFDEKYINQITKLADLTDIRNEEGKISEDKLTDAINKVLEDCEVFKVVKSKENKNQSGFTTIGVGQAEDGENSIYEKVRAAIKGY